MKREINKILICLLVICYSCSTKPEYPFPHPLECGDGKNASKLCIPQEVKDYCYFKPGTYWVYIDSLSGIKDCVYVTGSALIEIDNRTRKSLDDRRVLEKMRVETTHSYDQFRNYFETTTNVPGLNANVAITVTSTGFASKEGYFDYPYKLGTSINPNNNLRGIILKVPSLIVKTKVFSNLFYYYLERDGSSRRDPVDASPEHTYYLAKNIGLVKSVVRVIDTNNSQNTFNRVWLLQNYKIVQ